MFEFKVNLKLNCVFCDFWSGVRVWERLVRAARSLLIERCVPFKELVDFYTTTSGQWKISNRDFSLSLTPIHSLRHRRVRSRQYAYSGVLGFLSFWNLGKWWAFRSIIACVLSVCALSVCYTGKDWKRRVTWNISKNMTYTPYFFRRNRDLGTIFVYVGYFYVRCLPPICIYMVSLEI